MPFIFSNENVVPTPREDTYRAPFMTTIPKDSSVAGRYPAKKAQAIRARRKACAEKYSHLRCRYERRRPFPADVNYFRAFKPWFILPGTGAAHHEFTAYTRSLTTATKYLADCSRKSKSYAAETRAIQTPKVKFNSQYFFYTPQILHMMRELMYKNQRVKYLFKRCIQRWRAGRLRRINTEDVATLEVPVKPVYVYDWANRGVYVFEAATLARDIRNRLLTSSRLFCDPKAPRNMFTNADLTSSQLHFMMKDLTAAGYSDVILCAFTKSNYCLETFKERYSILLKQEIIEKIFKAWNTNECVDLVMDFFDMWKEAFDNHTQNSAMWDWAFENLNDGYPEVKAWRRLAKEYYMKYVSEPEHTFEVSKVKIGTAAMGLLAESSPRIYSAWLKPIIDINPAGGIEAAEAAVAGVEAEAAARVTRIRATIAAAEALIAADADADAEATADTEATADAIDGAIIATPERLPEIDIYPVEFIYTFTYHFEPQE